MEANSESNTDTIIRANKYCLSHLVPEQTFHLCQEGGGQLSPSLLALRFVGLTFAAGEDMKQTQVTLMFV